MNSQVALRLRGDQVNVDLDEIRRQQNGAAAIALCATKSGKLDKVVAADVCMQEAVWSRVKSTGKGFNLEQLNLLMDACGNEAPLFWLLLERGYDPRSLRRLESEQERENRELRERVAELERERAITVQLLRDVRA